MDLGTQENTLILLAQKAYQAQQMKRHYEEQEKDFLIQLKNACDNRSFTAGGYVFQKSVRKGSIDYIGVFKDHKIDIEPYRKEDVITWKLTFLEDITEQWNSHSVIGYKI